MGSDPSAISPSGQAARLLLAWNSRDAAGLREELRRSLELACPERARSHHEEQLQLLQAAAEGIRLAPNPLATKDPRLASCLDLLRHLAGTPTPRQ